MRDKPNTRREPMNTEKPISRRAALLSLRARITTTPIGLCPQLFLEAADVLLPYEVEGLIVAKLRLCRMYPANGGVISGEPLQSPKRRTEGMEDALAEIQQIQDEHPNSPELWSYIPMPWEIDEMAEQLRKLHRRRRKPQPCAVKTVRVA
jgi:hypothetical protein